MLFKTNVKKPFIFNVQSFNGCTEFLENARSSHSFTRNMPYNAKSMVWGKLCCVHYWTHERVIEKVTTQTAQVHVRVRMSGLCTENFNHVCNRNHRSPVRCACKTHIALHMVPNEAENIICGV